MNKNKKLTKKQIKELEQVYKKGLANYLFVYGGRAGLMFGGLMLLFDYLIWQNPQDIGWYVFYIIFFGLGMGLWGWHNLKKRITNE